MNLLNKILLFVVLSSCLFSCSKKDGFSPIDSKIIYTVRTTTELNAALAAVNPGDTIDVQVIQLDTKIVIERSGIMGAPITLKGNGVIIRGVSTNSNYGLWLKSNYWNIENLIFENFKKGIVLDSANFNTISAVTVRGIGEEGIHFRTNSSENTLQTSTVTDVGLITPDYGEGIYIGSSESNWCTYTSCGPDRSDRNIIKNNIILRTTAESIDIKEGTTSNQILQNNMSGSLLSGANFADSLIDIKGNSNLVFGNTFNSDNNSVVIEAVQTHVRVSGWGNYNMIDANLILGTYSSYGINNDTASSGNIISCSNVAAGANLGLSNVSCQ